MSYRQVTEDERYNICTQLKEGKSKTTIAKALGRSRTTIQRELKRNSDFKGHYKPLIAHGVAIVRRRESRRVTYFSKDQWDLIHLRLKEQWAPEQISLRFAQDGVFKIHFATIYRRLKKGKRKSSRLHIHLRQYNKKRRKGYGHPDSRGVLRGKRNIIERPKEANERSELGHFEVDLIRGYRAQGWVMSIIDRMARYSILVKLRNKTAEEINRNLVPILVAFGVKTVTMDNGCEFHKYKEMERATGVLFYFANPHKSWERGSVENMNGLVRQYLPKKMSFLNVTQEHCDFIAGRLNQRPRKILGMKTPEESYYGFYEPMHFTC